TVETAGSNSPGIVAQNRGNSPDTSNASVTIGNEGNVTAGGPNSYGVVINAAGNATLTVAAGGYLQAKGSGSVAFFGDSLNTSIQNSGTIAGDIGAVGKPTLVNQASGMLIPLTEIAVIGGSITNYGTIDLTQGASSIQIIGNLQNEGSGRVITATNHVAGTATQLNVQGTVELGGTLEVRPTALANRAVTTVTATEGLTLMPGFSTSRTHLFRFDHQQAGNSLLVQPQAEFTTAAGALGANQRQVAGHLQQLWDGGTSMDAGFTALARVKDAAGYRQALNSLSGETVGAVAAARFASSRSFITNLYSCPVYATTGLISQEGSCIWGRGFGNSTVRDTSTDALGYRSSSETLQVGGQWMVAPDWFAGGSLAYENSRLDGAQGTARVTGDSVMAGAVLKYQSGGWLLSGGIDAGYGWYDSRRQVIVGNFAGTAKGSPESWHVGAHGRVSYQMAFERFYLKPSLDLHATYVGSSAYAETGAAPFDLAVDGRRSLALSATAALEIGTSIDLGSYGTLWPYASAGLTLTHADDWEAKARFASLSTLPLSFKATTPVPDVLGRLTVGADLIGNNNWDVKLQYSADLGSGYQSHTGMAKLSYRF
ncbi:autotransporter outer membrane beta-barrel domain-containing protein, partial [Bosea caraganae]